MEDIRFLRILKNRVWEFVEFWGFLGAWKSRGNGMVGSRVSLVYLENFLGIFLSKENGFLTLCTLSGGT